MASKKLRNLLILLFCLYIAAFSLMYILLPKADFSEKEKRVLSSLPETSISAILDGSFESGIETWMSDHVPGRDALVGVNARYELFSGRNGLNGVISSGEKLVAAAEDMDEEAMRNKFSRINSFAETTGLPTDVLLVPTSGYIWQDELPMHAPYQDGRLAEIASESLNEGIGFIWPEEKLRSIADGRLYYNTDHHFTSRGAYKICSLYAQHAGKEMPAMDAYEVETVEGFYGSMYAKAGLWDVAPDTIEIWRSKNLGDVSVSFDDRESASDLFFTEHLAEMDKYPVFLDGNHGLVTIETGRSGGESLLVIRDSFGHCFAPFAADCFDRIVLADLRYYRKPLSALAAEMDIDRVLVLYGVDTFITDTNFGWLK